MVTKNDFIDKWIQKLTSGEFKQCSSRLGDYNDSGPPRRCCLGVACDLGQELGIKGAGWGKDQDIGDGVPGGWFRKIFKNNDPFVFAETGYKSLSNLNDTGTTFVEIAKLLPQLKDSATGDTK